MKKQVSTVFLISAGAITLGGCATYTNTPAKTAYFIVPCNIPGAFFAQPVSTADTPTTDLSQEPASVTGVATEQVNKTATTCLIAASNARPWGSAYSSYGYPPYRSRSRYFGSGIGVVRHGFGHRSGHHGGGHRRH